MKQAAITLDIEKGDTLLGGRFKNHKTVVKDIGTDELGQPTVNGMKLLSFRIAKKIPKEASMNQDYVKGFMDKCAELGVNPEALVKIAVYGSVGRSIAEKGLLAALEKQLSQNPKAEITTVRDQIRRLQTRPIDLAEDSHAIGSELQQLHNRLRDLERSGAAVKEWGINALRQRALAPVRHALGREAHRLDQLNPSKLLREKYRMNTILDRKAPVAPTARQARIQELIKNIRVKSEDKGYW